MLIIISGHYHAINLQSVRKSGAAILLLARERPEIFRYLFKQPGHQGITAHRPLVH